MPSGPFDWSTEPEDQENSTGGVVFDWESDSDLSGGTGRGLTSVNAPRTAPVPEQRATEFSVTMFETLDGADSVPLARELSRNGVEVRLATPSSNEVADGTDRGGWGVGESDVCAWGFQAPANGELSEDAEPLFVHWRGSTESRLVAAVFDGMGGAGAARIVGAERTLSEAYRASRIARFVTAREWCRSLSGAVRSSAQRVLAADSLAAVLQSELARAANQLKAGSESKVRGTMRRSFPTTIALAEAKYLRASSGGGRLHVRTLWAGDSRVWLLTPRGLQQITADDVQIADVNSQLRQDPPLKNTVSADRHFMLNEHRISINGPALLLVGTDGVSGYVRSPGEVELIVLAALRRAASTGSDVADALRDSFETVASDDVSGVLVGIGFSNVQAVVEEFKDRIAELETLFSQIDEAGADGDWVSAAAAVWEQQRTTYCSLLPKGG